MRLQVFVDRRRQFVTECEPGGVSTRVAYIREMIPDEAEIVVVLESERCPNVHYIVRKREETTMDKWNSYFQRSVEKER